MNYDIDYEIAKVIVDQILNGRFSGTTDMIKNGYDLMYSLIGYELGHEEGWQACEKNVKPIDRRNEF